MINAFNKRVEPRRVAGIPETAFFLVPLLVVCLAMIAVVPGLSLKGVFLAAGIGMVVLIIDTFRWFDLKLVRKAMERGNRQKKLPSWGAKNRKTYLDGFTWKTKIGDHGLIHEGPSVSIAFAWDGVKDRHYSPDERKSEHRRRVALLRTWSEEAGLVVENHLVREHDSSLADAYLREGERMHSERPMAPIVKDIRKQVVDLYRPLARSNRVFTVLSLAQPKRQGLGFLLKPQMGWRNRSAQDLYGRLMDIFKLIEADFSGALLMTADEYQQAIQRIRKPYVDPYPVEWRFNMADQVVTEKPDFDQGCMVLNNRYFYTQLIQGYPNTPLDWTLTFLEAPVDLHVSQILLPKPVDEAMDKAAKDAEYEAQMYSQKRGADRTKAKLRESTAYREYVTNHNLPVADNAFLITFSGTNVDHVRAQGERFKRQVEKNQGMIRDNEDLQRDLFETRLPGLGRNTLFAREDHADTIAAMMPVTTFSSGNTKHPESLRITLSGQLVGFAPSQAEVPHELVVAQTGGGKDTQFGLKFLETYGAIRYDIVEMGNSYQAAVEAVGGSYCRAREQVINPLAGYDEFQKTIEMRERGHGNLDADFVRSQADMLQPIFKGMQATQGYSRAEQICVEKGLRYLYEHPQEGATAPTLPMLLDALRTSVETTSDKQAAALEELSSELYEFMETETGRAFTAQDQFTISPIANAIDFGGFSGELLQYYMTFMVVRLATNAMSRGARSQIVLNEYRMLLENAGDPIRWITLTIDRMGRKEWVGLTRITQGLEEIRSVDPEALSSIPNRTLLNREDDHAEIGRLLKMPGSIIHAWEQFADPEVMNAKGYREGLAQETGHWHHLFLKFPKLALDIMNTRGEDKPLREIVFERKTDPYERIELFNQLKAQREAGTLNLEAPIEEAPIEEETEETRTDENNALI